MKKIVIGVLIILAFCNNTLGILARIFFILTTLIFLFSLTDSADDSDNAFLDNEESESRHVEESTTSIDNTSVKSRPLTAYELERFAQECNAYILKQERTKQNEKLYGNKNDSDEDIIA